LMWDPNNRTDAVVESIKKPANLPNSKVLI